MLDNSLENKSLENISESKEPKNYNEQFKQEMNSLIEQIELSDLQRQFMRSRWMSQMLWLESRAQQNRNRYYFLRLITIIGGVIVPALVSLNINGNNVKEIVGWVTFALSQAVAISAAVEEFFHYGERYRHYRNTAELMKIEGWQFFQLSGPYANVQNHSEVYYNFAQQVERIIQRSVEGYISGVVQEKYISEGVQEKEKIDENDDESDFSLQKDADIIEVSSIDKKHINAWISEISLQAEKLLFVEESYTLNFQVGDFIENNLAKTSSIERQDIPETGLNTDWVVSSSTVEITEVSKDSDISITHKEIGSKTVWLARFPLLIPRYKESEVQQLGIVPITSEDVNLTVLVFAKEKPYRQFDVNLNVVNTKLKAEIA